MGHEGWFDAPMGIELADPYFGQIGVARLIRRTHRHEEFAEFLIATGADKKVLGEAVV